MNTKDFALLNSRLYLPLVVRDILENPNAIQDDMLYSLHSVLSDYRPDSALLAMALSVKTIVQSLFIQTPQCRVAVMTCDQIIENYAEGWMTTFDDQEASETFLMGILEEVAGDLGALADLVQSVSGTQDEAAQQLLQVIQVQARAHKMIAEEFNALMDCEFMQGETGFARPPEPVFAAEDAYSELDMDMARYGADSTTQFANY